MQNTQDNLPDQKETTVAQQRLFDILSYIEKVEKLNEESFFTVAQHKVGFSEYQEKIRGLPGVHYNIASDTDGEAWLKVERILPEPCPEPEPLLKEWVVISQEPTKEPILKDAIVVKTAYKDSKLFKESGAVEVEISKDSVPPKYNPDDIIEEVWTHTDCPEVPQLYAEFCAGIWKSWSIREIPRRKTIELYGRLFELQRTVELEGSVRPLEVAWGVGIALWNTLGHLIQYPILTQLVELAFDDKDNSILVRPRETEPQIEVSAFYALDNPGAPMIVERGKLWAKERVTRFSPFARESFDEILRGAVSHLDKAGRYWPDHKEVEDDDKHLPTPDANLLVTDSWVLFARPRTANFLMQDLNKLKEAVIESDDIGGGPLAIVSDPTDDVPEFKQKSFRGICGVSSSGASSSVGGVKVTPGELFFPKPYNREQLCIVDLLEQGDGVVVQGPPGTGKTHTITNIICHYLAHGKKVLVTSKAEPALGVIRDNIPEGVRSLVVSILTNEKEGLKQIQNSVEQIGSQVTSASSEALRFQIQESKSRLDVLHEKIASWDSEIASIAKQHLSPLPFGDEDTLPAQLAEELMKDCPHYSWFPDELGAEESFKCKILEEDLIALGKARRAVGERLCYIDKTIPSADNLCDADGLLEIHANLVELSSVSERARDPRLARLKNTNLETIQKAEGLLRLARQLKDKVQEFEASKFEWVKPLHARMLLKRSDPIVQQLLLLAEEIKECSRQRLSMISDVVAVPLNSELVNSLNVAITRAAEGERPFNLLDFSNKDAKTLYREIKLNELPPQSPEGWKKVAQHMLFLTKLRELLNRWNALCSDIEGSPIPYDRASLTASIEAIGKSITLVKELVVDDESRVNSLAEEVFAKFPISAEYFCNLLSLNEIEKLLELYLPQHKLRAFEGVTGDLLAKIPVEGGKIISEIRTILTTRLGKSDQSLEELSAEWNSALEELKTIEALKPHFSVIENIAEKIQVNGAAVWADKLRTEPFLIKDEWMPPDSLRAWDWKYRFAYLQKIDQREKLKLLTDSKVAAENELSRTYQDYVKNLTWLSLKENLSNKRRSALQAYLTALKNMGKGKAKSVRGDRFRDDARNAMKDAYAAVPCWIMPHWRVSETLPPEIGLFDLVIIDEASQSDIWALPALLRSKKMLVVGDDEQISPTTFAREEDILRLRDQHLSSLPHNFQAQVLPGKSIYDLARVVFPQSHLTLIEHFRCVSPIIEFSNQLCYNGKIQCLRVAKASERINPPLVDVFVKGGFRDGKSKRNMPEAKAIVDEIEQVVKNVQFAGRTIGVVSLLGSEQAHAINTMILDRLGEDVVQTFNILCGDSMTFQGNERDIMFLSMVATADEAISQTKREIRQRFNVACSRARDRMYLFRSVKREDLKNEDLRARLIEHFDAPLGNRVEVSEGLREQCQSSFELAIFDALIEAGYHVIPQVESSGFYIDMVVEGDNDRRLAIECDGDQYHGPEKWAEDFGRQRVLERAGWRFWRCWGSSFYLSPEQCLQDLYQTLESLGISPSKSEKYVRPGLVEHREVDPNQPKKPETAEDAKASLNVEVSAVQTNDVKASESSNLQPEENPVVEEILPKIEVLAGRDGQVDVGETVEYCFTELPSEVLTFKIIELGNTDFAKGIVNVSDSLGAVLLGLREGDEVGVPSHDGTRIIRILKIEDLPGTQVSEKDNEGLRDKDTDEEDGMPDKSPGIPGSTQMTLLKPYHPWMKCPLPDPRTAKPREVVDGMVSIIETEGPMLCDRMYSLYCEAAGLGRMGTEIRTALDKAAIAGINKKVFLSQNEFRTRDRLKNVLRVPETEDGLPRKIGPRTFDEVPPSELASAMYLIFQDSPGLSVDELYRRTLNLYGVKRLSGGIRSILAFSYRNYFEKMLPGNPELTVNKTIVPDYEVSI